MAALALGCAAGGDGNGDGSEVASGGTGGTSLQGPGGAEHPVAPTPEPAETPLFGDGAKLEPVAPEEQRCDKVDFLYVVDNSPSMVGKQQNLATSFAGFANIVQQTLGTTDHQIMVVDTDDVNVGDVIVGYDHTMMKDSCDGMLGAGLITGSEGEPCDIMGHQRFLRDEQPNLVETFSCLARVGIWGNVDERPIDALLAATGASENEAGGCNAGFLREDAILVVTLITDEEDEGSSGDPAAWKRTLLQAKGGNEQAVVVLGLIGDNHIPGGLPGGPCDPVSGAPSPRLQRFVESFELGSLGSVCAEDYSEFFAEAVSTIDTACDTFRTGPR